MKNKILVIAGIILLIVVVGGLWFYFGKTGMPVNTEKELGGNMLVKEGFSIVLPKGWVESEDMAEGITALAFDPNEQITEEAAKKISFASYLSIGQDSSQEKNMIY